MKVYFRDIVLLHFVIVQLYFKIQNGIGFFKIPTVVENFIADSPNKKLINNGTSWPILSYRNMPFKENEYNKQLSVPKKEQTSGLGIKHGKQIGLRNLLGGYIENQRTYTSKKQPQAQNPINTTKNINVNTDKNKPSINPIKRWNHTKGAYTSKKSSLVNKVYDSGLVEEVKIQQENPSDKSDLNNLKPLIIHKIRVDNSSEDQNKTFQCDSEVIEPKKNLLKEDDTVSNTEEVSKHTIDSGHKNEFTVNESKTQNEKNKTDENDKIEHKHAIEALTYHKSNKEHNDDSEIDNKSLKNEDSTDDIHLRNTNNQNTISETQFNTEEKMDNSKQEIVNSTETNNLSSNEKNADESSQVDQNVDNESNDDHNTENNEIAHKFVTSVTEMAEESTSKHPDKQKNPKKDVKGRKSIFKYANKDNSVIITIYLVFSLITIHFF